MKARAWRSRGRLLQVAVMLAVLAIATAALVEWLNVRGETAVSEADAASTPVATGAVARSPGDAAQIARGAYLARAGNCISCHTTPGGAAYAGGRAIETPFGAVIGPNLTPDRKTGIGDWTAAHFWRAMHHGRSRDGRLLYPAFPYTSYTHVTRQDTDAIYAFLQAQPAIRQANPPHRLRFPYNTQVALALWRALFFRAAPMDGPRDSGPSAASHVSSASGGIDSGSPPQAAAVERGRYLVEGLGHCGACHAARNSLGATIGSAALGGGLIALQNWYAPALNSPDEAGLAEWSINDIALLLHTGRAPGATVAGPMAEVVYRSTQYLDDEDLRSIASYLKALPQHRSPVTATHAPPEAAVVRRGTQLYEQHCAQCHGAQGEGRANAFPALAGNRAVTLQRPTNLIQTVLRGGYLPATAGNPLPHGMPPFIQTLDDADIAAVVTHIRTSWGNLAEPVDAVEVYRLRAGQ